MRRYRAKIVPHVMRQKSFTGRPRPGHPERFEVCEQDVAAMMPKMANLPMHYNHDTRRPPVGRVIASYRNPADRAWEIEYELDGATREGADMIGWIEKGHMKGVSLQHLWGTNEPLEVSICWRGMRPGSETYEAIAASKIRKLVHFDSNSGRYMREVDADDPIAIAASADAPPDDDLIILETMSDPMYIAASNNINDADAAPADSMSFTPHVAPAAAPAAAAAAPAAAADAAFPRFADAKSILQSSGGIMSSTSKQQVLESMGQLELEKERMRTEKEAALAELRAYKEKEASARLELETKMRREQEAADAETKQKIGDFMAAYDDRPEALEHASKVINSMTPAQLQVVSQLGESVKASYGRPVYATKAEQAMSEFLSQQRQQMQHPPQQPQQQQPQQVATGGSGVSLSVAASWKPRAAQPQFGVPHDRPHQTMAIAASKQKTAMGAGGNGAYRPAQEYEMRERASDMQTWVAGAGGNVNFTRISPNPEIQAAMAHWVEETPAGEGTGNFSVDRISLCDVISDKSTLHRVQSSHRANRQPMPQASGDIGRAHLSGLVI